MAVCKCSHGSIQVQPLQYSSAIIKECKYSHGSIQVQPWQYSSAIMASSTIMTVSKCSMPVFNAAMAVSKCSHGGIQVQLWQRERAGSDNRTQYTIRKYTSDTNVIIHPIHNLNTPLLNRNLHTQQKSHIHTRHTPKPHS